MSYPASPRPVRCQGAPRSWRGGRLPLTHLFAGLLVILFTTGACVPYPEPTKVPSGRETAAEPAAEPERPVEVVNPVVTERPRAKGHTLAADDACDDMVVPYTPGPVAAAEDDMVRALRQAMTLLIQRQAKVVQRCYSRMLQKEPPVGFAAVVVVDVIADVSGKVTAVEVVEQRVGDQLKSHGVVADCVRKALLDAHLGHSLPCRRVLFHRVRFRFEPGD